MLEILPSTTWPGWRRSEDLLADLLALLLEDRAAREDDVVAGAVELDHLALERLAHELVEVVDAADVDQRGGQEAADAEVEDQAALDDLDHGALDGLAGLGGGLDPAPCLLEAGALLREDQAPLLVLLGEDERVDLLAERDLVGGIDRAADRELVRGDDALRLVADVDQDLVLVDAHDLAADDVALVEGLDRRVVVGDELAVDLDHEVVGRQAPAAPRRQGRSTSRSWTRRLSMTTPSLDKSAFGATAAIRSSTLAPMPVRATKRGAERTPLAGDYDVLVCGASFAGLAVARELAGSGARVLVIDRYEIGERQTSACAAPTDWLEALGLADSMRQTFARARRPHAAHDRADAPALDVLDLRLPRALRAAVGAVRTPSSRRPRSRAAPGTDRLP